MDRSSRSKNNSWFVNFGTKVESPALRLFCFPYAGGSATIYKDWAKTIANDVELNAVQLPGRGVRIREPLIQDYETLVSGLLAAIKPLTDVPFVFFGHSMGAQVAWELARYLRKAGLPLPKVLIVSARSAPHVKSQRKPFHQLPEREFIEKVKTLNGIPEEALRHQELMDIVSPILRADFKVIETWNYQPEVPLPMQMVTFRGENDTGVKPESVAAWRELSSRRLIEKTFPGNHFFINSVTNRVLEEVNAIINQFARNANDNPIITASV